MGIIVNLEKFIRNCFSKLGYLVGLNYVKFIVFTLAISLSTSIGFLRFNEADNVRKEYTPLNAPSQKEYAIAKEFFGQNGTLDPIHILVEAQDGGSLLRTMHRHALINLLHKVEYNITAHHHGSTYSYRDICSPYCEMNFGFQIFLNHYNEKARASFYYPMVDILGIPVFIGNNAYGVTLENDTSLVGIRTAILQFFVVSHEDHYAVSNKWISEVRKQIESGEFDLFRIYITSDSLISNEVRRMGIETFPILLPSFALMAAFVIGSSFRQDPIRSKPWESFIGCIIPILAVFTTTGIISGLSISFQPIAVASFFLVLSVGIDDVFIILRAWDFTNLNSDIPHRLSKTLENAGPSVTISSITNALSFAIGIFSSTPAIRTFCIYSSVSILICFFYQLTLFTSVLAAGGHREKRGYQSFICCRKSDSKSKNVLIEHFVCLQMVIIKIWCRIISSWWARIILLLLMIVYYYISVNGIEKLHASISLSKMALPDSYLQNFELFEKAMRDMQPISVFITKPGDLRHIDRLNGIKAIVNEYEHSVFAYGNKSTLFWLTQYEEFLQFYSEKDYFNYVDIPSFLRSLSYSYLSSFLKLNISACYDNDPRCITSFFFITNFHQVIKYDEMIPAVKDWRRIAANYPDYEIYPFSDHSAFVDQTIQIEYTVLWSVMAALFFTATACFIFIPSITSIVCAVFSVFSISIGIFGMLSHWGVDLDPLSMVALLMAIGFSVDFTAHISYHYYKTSGKDPRQRLEEAFKAIAWPMIQVGVSTIIGIIPLLFKQSYLALVFIKTVLVVVALGAFHGLVVLPAILAAVTAGASASSISGSSENSSQKSCERIHGYHGTEKLFRKKMNFCSEQQSRKFRERSKGPERINAIAPISPLAIISSSSSIYVHKIELGRSDSILPID